MATTIRDLLGLVPLTKLVERVKSGIPDNLPAAFHRVNRKVVGNACRYTQVRGTRQTARFSMYGAAASLVEQGDIEEKDVKLLHAYSKIKMDPLIMQCLRNYTDYTLMERGKDEITRQSERHKRRHDNLRLASMYMMLGSGVIYYDGEGNLLPTSSGAKVTVDFAIPANNQGQLNGLISASWANANTDIPLQLRNLRFQAAKDTGYELKHAFYGLNVPSYLTQNNYVLDYLARNPQMARPYLDKGEIPDGLFGFSWTPIYTSFWEDSSNTNQSFFGADTVVFTPEIASDVYELVEGTYDVPTTYNPVADLIAANNSFQQMYGLCSWAQATADPPAIWQFAADTWCPLWLIPASVYQADVVP